MRALVLFLAALSASFSFATRAAALDASYAAVPQLTVQDAAVEFAALPTGRIRLTRPASGAPPPYIPGAGEQTAYFGPSTLGGHGGARPDGLVPPATAPDTANYTWSTTYNWAAPKGAYGAVRATLSGCETMTVTDAAATVYTFNLCADETRAGKYTVRWRDGDDQTSGVGATAQLRTAFAASSYGDHIAFRGGTTLNTTADCASGCIAGDVYNGAVQYRFGCSTGNCNAAGFNGSNHRVIRPELGKVVTIGPISFENAGVTGTIFQGFVIDGEAESYNDAYLVSSVTGAEDIVFRDLTIFGSSTDAYGKDRPSGIQVCLDCAATIENVYISYVKNGISTQHSLGTSADIVAGSVAPNTGPVTIKNATLREIGRDSLATQCPRYLTVEDSVFTDQKTEVTVGSSATVSGVTWVNPFDSARQAHSDKVQLNYQNTSSNVCAWNYYPGLKFKNNFFARGAGRSNLPFWSTANGFPSPNNYGGGSLDDGIPTEAFTPDPATAALGDSQGLFSSNFAAHTTINPKTLGGVQRTYAATLDAPEIEGNVIFSSFTAGISLPPIRNGYVRANTVIGPREAAAANLVTWSGYGNSGVIIAGVEGSPEIARNHGNLSSFIGVVATPPASQIVEVPIANYGAVFNNPTGNLSPRDAAEYRLHYRPLPGSVLEISPGVYSGATCPDGSSTVPVAGVCPVSFANDNAPARVADGVWRWAA